MHEFKMNSVTRLSQFVDDDKSNMNNESKECCPVLPMSLNYCCNDDVACLNNLDQLSLDARCSTLSDHDESLKEMTEGIANPNQVLHSNRTHPTCSVIVKDLPEQLFSSKDMKEKFEQMFSLDGSIKNAVFIYFSTFRRCRVDLGNAEDAELIKSTFSEFKLIPTCAYSSKTYLLRHLKVKYRNEQSGRAYDFQANENLFPPKIERAFLISPPASPPIGWEQTVENAPLIDHNELVHALALAESNRSGCSRQLLAATDTTPQIIVHCCAFDDSSNRTSSFESEIEGPLPKTKRP